MLDYTGIKCPVCGVPFRSGDDIVVCPECGAPYHRACYQEKGECHGEIALKRAGTNGFGFDPVFIADEENPEKITLAQMSDLQKNRISHRANALKAVLRHLSPPLT